jgi:hypothetical protein
VPLSPEPEKILKKKKKKEGMFAHLTIEDRSQGGKRERQERN